MLGSHVQVGGTQNRTTGLQTPGQCCLRAGLHLTQTRSMTGSACLLFPEMEQKEEKPSEDGATVSPTAGTPGSLGGGASAEGEAKGTAVSTITEGPPDGAGRQERALAGDGVAAECQAEADGLGEVEVEPKVKAEPPEKDDGEEETTAAPRELSDGKEEDRAEPKQAEGKEEAAQASGKQKAGVKAAEPEAGEKGKVGDEAKAEPKQAAGEPEATAASQEESHRAEMPKAEAQEKAGAPEAESDSERRAAPEAEAKAGAETEPQEGDLEEAEVSEAEQQWEGAPPPSGVPRPPALFLGERPVFLPLISRARGAGCSTVVSGCLPDRSEAFTKP